MPGHFTGFPTLATDHGHSAFSIGIDAILGGSCTTVL
jgi:hypothetical protein